MTSRNIFVLSGNVSQKPRQFPGKTPKTVVNVAVDEFWIDQKTGEKRKRTDYLSAYTFNPKIGEFLATTVCIGDQIIIDGHLRANNYERGADKVYTTELEIVRLDAYKPADRAPGDKAT